MMQNLEGTVHQNLQEDGYENSENKNNEIKSIGTD